MVGARRVLPVVMVFVLAGLGNVTSAAVVRAEGCLNEQLRAQEGYALELPDCRAYEQVSPVEKNFSDALGEAGVVQSAPSGERVTFFSRAPFPGVLSATSPSLYLGTRGGKEWSTQGLVPATAPSSLPEHGSASVLGLTEDLSTTIVDVEPSLEAGSVPGLYSYLRDNTTGSLQLLGPGIAAFADATAGGLHIIFESNEQLLPTAAPGTYNLYEWDGNEPPGEQLSLAGVLPSGKAPSGGSVAGPGGPAVGRRAWGATGGFYTQNTISADGSRIFFSDTGTGRIYMREPEAARTIPVSAGIEPAYWRAATADGSEVFYTEGEDLYRFDAGSDTREALTSGAAGVLGTLGIASENGSYAYYVATEVLAGNENGNGEQAEAEAGNLYEWHDGTTSFIAKLSPEGSDSYNWQDFYSANPRAPAHGEKSSRVTPSGTTVLFSSQARLTPYDNAGFNELYLYDAVSGKLTCASCNPRGTPATSAAYLAGSQSPLGGEPHDAFLTRNLSDDGSRVFFQTEEALVSADTNKQTDVYEWERESAGSCERASASFSASSGGCLYLISTGQSAQPSYFGDAGASGDDVFFFTRQQLVGQDRDENYDIYDARVDGGIAAQNPPLPPAPCAGEETCRAGLGEPPAFDAPSSTTITGNGNLPTSQGPAVKSERLTRAQKLSRALRACRKKQAPKMRRACEARAHSRYGVRKKKREKS
jgi:hypothetical protein